MISSALMVGLVLGGTYALMALGLTIQYGISRIMNLAYGEIIIAAAFLTFTLFAQLGLNPLISLLLVVPAGFAMSWLLYLVVMQPLVQRARASGRLEVDSILATFGLMFCAQGALLLTFGSGYVGYVFMEFPIKLLGASIAAGKFLGFVLAVVIGAGLYLVFTRTRWGAVMRAVATRPAFAPLVGIDVKHSARVAFSIGGALAAAGGAILSMYQPFSATDGVLLTMKALIIVIMGGVGNLFGALLAGLMLGLVETAVSVALDPGLTLAATYLMFLAVLLWRPTGLFGRRAAR